MRAFQPLPTRLQLQVFTRSRAISEGVSPARLRGSAAMRHHHGIYGDAAAAFTPWEVLGGLASTIDGSWVSHSTALESRGLWVPESAAGSLHLARPRGARAPRHQAVQGHQFQIDPDDLQIVNGVLTSSIPRAWREAAAQLSVRELVQLGDFLVRYPREHFEGRSLPYTSIEHLAEMVRKYPAVPGSDTARVARQLVRVGSDSPPETDCRLAIIQAGLPEPELQLLLFPDDPFSPSSDLGFRRWRIAIQYEGAVHRSADRHWRDMRRDRAFEVEGWTVLGVGARDRAENFLGLVRQLERLLR